MLEEIEHSKSTVLEKALLTTFSSRQSSLRTEVKRIVWNKTLPSIIDCVLEPQTYLTICATSGPLPDYGKERPANQGHALKHAHRNRRIPKSTTSCDTCKRHERYLLPAAPVSKDKIHEEKKK